MLSTDSAFNLKPGLSELAPLQLGSAIRDQQQEAEVADVGQHTTASAGSLDQPTLEDFTEEELAQLDTAAAAAAAGEQPAVENSVDPADPASTYGDRPKDDSGATTATTPAEDAPTLQVCCIRQPFVTRCVSVCIRQCVSVCASDSHL